MWDSPFLSYLPHFLPCKGVEVEIGFNVEILKTIRKRGAEMPFESQWGESMTLLGLLQISVIFSSN